MSSAWYTCWNNPSIIYTLLISVRGHAKKHVFLRLDNRSDGLHVFPTLTSTDFLDVGSKCVFSYLFFPAMTVTFGICPCGGFIMCSSFVDLFVNFHLLENIAGLIVGLTFKVPSLYLVLLLPSVKNGV